MALVTKEHYVNDIGRQVRILGESVAEIYRTIYAYNHTRVHTALKMPPKQYAILKTLVPNHRYLSSEKVS